MLCTSLLDRIWEGSKIPGWSWWFSDFAVVMRAVFPPGKCSHACGEESGKGDPTNGEGTSVKPLWFWLEGRVSNGINIFDITVSFQGWTHYACPEEHQNPWWVSAEGNRTDFPGRGNRGQQPWLEMPPPPGFWDLTMAALIKYYCRNKTTPRCRMASY